MTLNMYSKELPNFEQYLDNLQEDTQVFFRKSDLAQLHLYLGAKANTIKRNLSKEIHFHLGGLTSVENKEHVLRYLIEVLGVSKSSLTNYKLKTKGLSLSKAEILVPLLQFPKCKDFVTEYIEYTETITRLRQVGAYLKEKGKEVSENLLAVSYHYESKSTGRYYTRDENVQGMTLEMAECMVAPEGHFLFWGDFAQIDLRVAYHTVLRNPKLDEYFNTTEDKYHAIAKMVDLANDVAHDPIRFLKQRNMYKTAILARSYGAGDKLIKEKVGNAKFVQGLNKFFNSNQVYSNFQKQIKNSIDFGHSVDMKDYFDVRQSYPITSSKSDDLTRTCLNYPIQSTSNSIVVHWVNKTIKKFRDLGYGPDKVRVYLVRHDEPVFMLHNDVLKDLWVFKDHSEVQVDDWNTLTMTANFGERYKHTNENIQSIYENVSKKATLTPAKPKSRSKAYFPVKHTNRYHIVRTLESAIIYIERGEEFFNIDYPGKTVVEKLAELPCASHEEFMEKVIPLSRAALSQTDLGPNTQYIIFNTCLNQTIANKANDRFTKFVDAHSEVTSELQSHYFNQSPVEKVVIISGQEAATS